MNTSPIAPRLLHNIRSMRIAPRSIFLNGFHSIPRARARPQGRNTPSINNSRMQRRTAKIYARPQSKLEQMVLDARVQHPILFPVMLFGASASVILLTVMAWNEYRREKLGSSAYPPEVEERLRLALHYTHISPDPEAASQYFLEAIKKAEEVGMDPFSKEAIGIRVRFSQMMEEFGHVKAAIEILDGVINDFDQKLAEIDELHAHKKDTPSEWDVKAADFRKNLIKGIVKIKIKVSSLYESDYIQDSTMAKQTLSDAVGLVVKETKDPQFNTFTDDNGAGLSPGEIAAMLSQMGDLYATSGEEENAVQVYMLTLQPLRVSCNGSKSCKEVQVLSNIAATMDQALKRPTAKINGKPATKASLAAGRRAALKWADQAIATASSVNAEDRDEICEAASISAQMTRADLLLENGDKKQSHEAFSSLLPMLKERNLVPLIEAAEQGLKRTSD